MRIALMTNNYKPVTGGVPISIERLKRGLEKQGHRVTVFAPSCEGAEEEDGVFRYAALKKHSIGGIPFPNPCDLRIEREFKKQSFGIIHVHHPMLIGRTAIRLSHKYGIPLVFTYHTRYEKYVECYTGGLGKTDKVMPLYLRTFLRHCDYVFAPTAGIRDYLETACRVPDYRLGILPTGIEERSFRVTEAEKEAVRRRYAPDGVPLFLTVSRMAAEKNIVFLLESLAEFKRLWKRPFSMVLVGDGPERVKYEKLCEKLGISEETVFTGMLPNGETAAYYAAADAFLFASRTETQGIVILEAFAGGTPVLAVRASGVEDLVETGVNGVLTGEDRGEYAAAMLDFCEGRLEGKRLAENAYAAGLCYREETVALEAARVYNEVLRGRCRQPLALQAQ